MQSAILVASVSRRRVWTGRVLSTLAALFVALDAVSHIAKPAQVVDAFAQLGVPLHLSIGIGVIALACTALYVIPRTSVLGAILLTGYLGGATATQVRAEAALFPVLFPSIVAALFWGGLVLRDTRVRDFILGRAE
jgi:hypothetical protein